ncbi:MAG TPA: MBL fold metallo-hydrolase, partial [Candidatus Omnitrophota bacterium]|nr:MBL fold metallo-hydrolase [Candidatus Omnitrophota bacterium]
RDCLPTAKKAKDSKMKITLLAQGSTLQQRAKGHWGIAFLIGQEILFDAFGDAHALEQAIQSKKVDLSCLKHIVISHDHWDHTNGLWSILPRCPQASVYVCRRVSSRLKESIRSFRVKLVEVQKPVRIVRGVHTAGQIKGLIKDQIIYEQSLVISSLQGLTLLTGCSHPGILSVVNHVHEHFHKMPCRVIGGLHLKDTPAQEIKNIAHQLKKDGVKTIIPLHCTGKQAVRIFKRVFKKECCAWPAGKKAIQS